VKILTHFRLYLTVYPFCQQPSITFFFYTVNYTVNFLITSSHFVSNIYAFLKYLPSVVFCIFQQQLQYASLDSINFCLCSLGHVCCFVEMVVLFQVLHGLRTCVNLLTVISHLTTHFKLIWIMTDIPTQLV
jgi:hypothetical protein